MNQPDSQPATTQHHTQVVIVGNGPVGQTAALLLARWGIDCIVLDRRPQRDVIGSKAICQQRDVLDVWESVGVGHKIAAEGVTWDAYNEFMEKYIKVIGDEKLSKVPDTLDLTPYVDFHDVAGAGVEQHVKFGIRALEGHA